MRDAYQREINYLRISVTDRCNFRCIYCMPPEGVIPVSHEQILRNEEIVKLVEAASQVGIRKIRLTGGEPLVRRGFISLVEALGNIPLIDDLALTTNAMLLPEMAGRLKKAGLNRVNISLDTLNADTFRRITRNGDLAQVWRGIEASLQTGFNPVKINTVVMRGVNQHEIPDLARLTFQYPLHVRFIELMPAGGDNQWSLEKRVPVSEVRTAIEDVLGGLRKTQRPSGNGPASYYQLPGAIGTIGFISPISHGFCHQCNRLRLTSDGMIRQCLYSGQEIDIKTPLRSGAGIQELKDVFVKALVNKPAHHNLHEGWHDKHRVMPQIGG